MPSFILRNLDPEFWAKVQAKATAEGVTVKALILRLLSQWLAVVILAVLTVGCTSPDEPTRLPEVPVRTHGTPSSLIVTATSGVGVQAGSAAVSVHVLDAFSVPVKDVAVRLETTIGPLHVLTVAMHEQSVVRLIAGPPPTNFLQLPSGVPLRPRGLSKYRVYLTNRGTPI
jgi:hypothetical protein